VTIDVDQHVVPAHGARRATFTADDPDREVDAPTWKTPARVLVVVSPGAPASYFNRTEGHRLVRDWQEGGSPRTPRDECRLT
jgi:hypothetical protein